MSLSESWSNPPPPTPHLEKIRRINQGSYGFIYRAQGDGRRLAVKRNIVDSKASFIVSVRELDLLARINGHPSIVRLHKIYIGNPFGESVLLSPITDPMRRDDRIYFIFEMARMDLGSLMRYSPPWRIKLRAILDLLLGIEYLHAQGIIHRDIKPQNILVFDREADQEKIIRPTLINDQEARSYPQVENWTQGVENQSQEDWLNPQRISFQICDFGLGKPWVSGGQTARVSTCWYRAPEVVFSPSRIGPPIDIWSVGCVVVELFLGRNLFEGVADKEREMTLAFAEIFPDQIFIDSIYTSAIVRILGEKQVITYQRDWRHRLDVLYQQVASERDEKTAGQLISLIQRLLHVDPQRRITATEAINDPLFDPYREYTDDVRRRYPPKANPIPIINLVTTPERSLVVETLLQAMQQNPHKIRSRMLFQGLDLFDRYLNFEVRQEGGLVTQGVSSNDQIRIKALSCLYLSIKYFTSMSIPPSFEEIIPPDLRLNWALEMAESFEYRLIVDVCKFMIYRATPYELSGLHGDDALKLFRVYGSIGSEWNDVPLNLFVSLYQSLNCEMNRQVNQVNPVPLERQSTSTSLGAMIANHGLGNPTGSVLGPNWRVPETGRIQRR